MNFRKPPVIEAWIEFKLDLTDESVEWDEDRAKKFVATFFPSFTHTEFFGRASVAIDLKTGETTINKSSFERIRAFTESRDKCVQAGRDILIFNYIKKDSWPGYKKLEPDAVDALNKFLEFRGLSKLTGVVLHYRDIVCIPEEENGCLKLENYFTVHPEVPDKIFGTMSGFSIALQIPEVCEDANMVLAINSLPRIDASEKVLKFRMDWHITCNKEIENINAAKEWLGKAHTGLRQIFIAAFTKPGLDLFEPIEE